MRAVEIRPDIYWIGVNDRTTDLFENLWPTAEEGVAYNAYLITDDQRAIIDSAKALKTSEFLEQIESVADISQIGYLVINHMEPDHSGVVGTLRRIAPQITMIVTERGKAELDAFYGITQNVRVVKDGETISLGKRTLKFISTPMVHSEATGGLVVRSERSRGSSSLPAGTWLTPLNSWVGPAERTSDRAKGRERDSRGSSRTPMKRAPVRVKIHKGDRTRSDDLQEPCSRILHKYGRLTRKGITR